MTEKITQEKYREITDDAYRFIGGDQLVEYMHDCAVLRMVPERERIVGIVINFNAVERKPWPNSAQVPVEVDFEDVEVMSDEITEEEVIARFALLVQRSRTTEVALLAGVRPEDVERLGGVESCTNYSYVESVVLDFLRLEPGISPFEFLKKLENAGLGLDSVDVSYVLAYLVKSGVVHFDDKRTLHINEDI